MALDPDRCMLECGDSIAVLKTFAPRVFRCCVTSPPYFGLRDYGVEGQAGLEKTPEEYVAKMVEVFREVRRVLTDDGTLWLNLGDSYNAYNGNRGASTSFSAAQESAMPKYETGRGLTVKALKNKDMIGIPWMVAFALRTDGWYLRSDNIWAKPNPMPESVIDRPTRSHEYVFHLSKSDRYYYDYEASQEPAVGKNIHDLTGPGCSAPGQTPQTGSRKGRKNESTGRTVVGFQDRRDASEHPPTRNRRSVWTICTEPYKGAHYAVMPTKLVEPCILAGSAVGDIVLDPFYGTGTVGVVALRHDRNFVGIDLDPRNLKLAEERIGGAT